MECGIEQYFVNKTKDEVFQIIDGLENLAGPEYMKDEYLDYCRMIEPCSK